MSPREQPELTKENRDGSAWQQLNMPYYGKYLALVLEDDVLRLAMQVGA